jgi:hypothetical protein
VFTRRASSALRILRRLSNFDRAALRSPPAIGEGDERSDEQTRRAVELEWEPARNDDSVTVTPGSSQ